MLLLCAWGVGADVIEGQAATGGDGGLPVIWWAVALRLLEVGAVGQQSRDVQSGDVR